MKLLLALFILAAIATTTPAAAEELKALSSFQDCQNCPEMVVIAPGSFVMGVSSKKEKAIARQGYEQRGSVKVDIGYTYAIGKYELTVGEFGAFVDATGYAAGGPCLLRLPDSGPDKHKFIGEVLDNPDNMIEYGVTWVKDASFRVPGAETTDRQPATCISRDDIEAYLAWLSEKTGRHYRFPSSAEWEYATRAGTTSVWFWGDDPRKACDYANFADRKSYSSASVAAPCADKIAANGAVPVGSYKPNPWGLYDTVGNVLDLVADCNTSKYDNDAPTDGSPYMADGNRSPAPAGEEECAAADGDFAGRGFEFDGVVNTLASFAATFADRKNRSNFIASGSPSRSRALSGIKSRLTLPAKGAADPRLVEAGRCVAGQREEIGGTGLTRRRRMLAGTADGKAKGSRRQVT
jgi:formylglycine-generating enzyme required for sulfatase activity